MIIHTPPLILLRPQEYYCLQLLQTCSEPERKNDWIQPASRKINLPSRYLQFSPLETTSSTHFETLFSSTQKAEIHSDTPGQLTTNSFHCPLPASETSLSLPRATTAPGPGQGQRLREKDKPTNKNIPARSTLNQPSPFICSSFEWRIISRAKTFHFRPRCMIHLQLTHFLPVRSAGSTAGLHISLLASRLWVVSILPTSRIWV